MWKTPLVSDRTPDGTAYELHGPEGAPVVAFEELAERLVVAHTSVIEAILARDETQALNWLSKHLRDYRKGCIMAGADFDRPISDFLDLEKAMEFAGRSTWANRRPSAVN